MQATFNGKPVRGPRLILVAAAILLSACGNAETPAVPSATPPQASQPPVTVETATEAVRPTETGEATVAASTTAEAVVSEVLPPSPEALSAVRELILARTQDQQMLDATLYEIAGYPVPGARSMLIHWEDLYAGMPVGCTGYAIVTDGTNEIQTISGGCGALPAPTAITIYPGRGVDAAGDQIAVVFGEIYDERVDTIRAAVTGAEYEARITGSGYLIELPADMSVVVTAYDEQGSTLYSGSPSSGQ